MEIGRRSKRNYIVIILGIIMCVFFLILTYKSFKLMVSGVKTTGIVTYIQRHRDTGDETEYSVFAKYDCGSKKGIEGKSIQSSDTYHYNIGEKITLYCDEDDPRKFLPEKFENYILLLFFFFIILVIFCLICLIFKERKKQELMQFGKKVDATITKLIPYGRVDDQQGYRIEAMYMDDVFLSEMIVANANNEWKVGDKIDVYLDCGDNSRYWMDIDSVFEKPVDNTTIIG